MTRRQTYTSLFTVILLLFAGCNRQPSPTPGPQPTQATATPATQALAATSQQEIQIKSVGRNAQIVHIVKPGTALVWTGTMPFYIHFLQGNNFCEEPSVPRYQGFYAATKTAAAGSEYRLQCTVKHDLPASTEFTYEVLGMLPPKPPPQHLLLHTTPCGGCDEGTPPPNSGN